MTPFTVYVREITRTDLPQINHWRQQRTIVDNLGDVFRYVNTETDEKWFEHYMAHRQTEVRLAICLKSDQTHIGNVYLLGIDQIARSAVFHLFISREYQGQSYGYQATQLALHHGFNDLNLHRISLTVLGDNQKARDLYEKCGFTLEGMARQACFKNGHYVDAFHMGVLRNEVNITLPIEAVPDTDSQNKR